jgi:hypothetical protein
VQAVVDQAGTFNDLQMSSDPGTSGTLTVTGAGSNYTWLASDTGVAFRAAHTLQTLVPATVQVFLKIAGGGFVGAAPVTITTGTLTQFLIDQPDFNIGGSIAAGTTIDGYQLVLTGGQASGLVLDDLEIVGGVPEPSVLLTLTLGLGLLGVSARRFRAA